MGKGTLPLDVVSRLTGEAARAASWLRLCGLAGSLVGGWVVVTSAALSIGFAVDAFRGMGPADRNELSPVAGLLLGTAWTGVGVTAFVAGRSLLACAHALKEYSKTRSIAALVVCFDRYRLFLKSAVILVTFAVLVAGGWLVSVLLKR